MLAMLIALPGALPPPSVATALAGPFAEHAPHLAAWLARGSAHVTTCHPEQARCTPWEAWQLNQAGFIPAPGQEWASGLGPWCATVAGTSANTALAPDEPVWLAELVHMAVSTEGAALVPAERLDITQAESAELYRLVAQALPDSDFSLEPLSPTQWRVRPKVPVPSTLVSPALAATGLVHHWWPQDDAMRPWRRLLNEIQMLWHDAAPNVERETKGQLTLNGLWLYGGATPWPALPAQPAWRVIDDLVGPAREEDWHAWLQAWHTIDERDLATLATQDPAAQIVLFGTTRHVTLTSSARPSWLRWLDALPLPKKNWNDWWSLPD